MIQKGFLWMLGCTGGATMILMWVIAQFSQVWSRHFMFGLVCVVFFVLFTLVAYIRAMQAVRSENKNTFTAQFMALLFIKMLLSILIVVVYSKTVPKGSGAFMGLFLLPYIIFSVLEYYYLTQIAKLN